MAAELAGGGRGRGVIAHYRAYLPVTDTTPVVTLGEGDTPLVAAPHLGAALGVELYLKLEGVNPTCSFKDRGMTMAVTKVVEEGFKAVICASTGNTSASAAAYAAKAGIRAIVVIPEGKIAMGKLAQAVAYGAHVVSIPGNFDVALDVVRAAAAALPIALVNSVNPYRIEGQKTGAFEICDALGGPPAYHCIPVGNAGNITSYWKGYREYREAGVTDRLPVMCGFQAAGAAPLVLGHKVEAPETIATAIRIGNPARADEALAAAHDSGGFIDSVTDDEILAAYKLVALTEGVFCEPASAASIAGLKKAREQGRIPAGAVVACVLTGHGLKDPDTAVRTAAQPVFTSDALAEIERALATPAVPVGFAAPVTAGASAGPAGSDTTATPAVPTTGA
jgi:threonine synthase